MKTMMRTAVAMLAALTMAGCAANRAGEAGGAGGDGEDRPVSGVLRVTVENDGTIPSQVRVYLIRGTGQESLLGSMSTLGTETLSTEIPMVQDSYRLRAVGGTSYSLTSPRISLRGNENITWDMRRNVFRLGTSR